MIIRLFLVVSFANNKSRVFNLFSDESLHIGGVKTCRVEAAANGSWLDSSTWHEICDSSCPSRANGP